MLTGTININNNRRITTIILTVAALAFSTVFLMTGMIINTVYGVEEMTLQDYENIKMNVLEGPYAEVMTITTHATNLTEGYLIDGYVKTIENSTSYSGLGESVSE